MGNFQSTGKKTINKQNQETFLSNQKQTLDKG